MEHSRESAEMMQQAKNTYEWSERRLIRKSDGRVVAEVVYTKNLRAAKNKSGNTTTTIGEYEKEQEARHGVDLQFGLASYG